MSVLLSLIHFGSRRLSSKQEHIWWDQATALRQAGLLAEFVDWPGDPSPEGKKQKLRLPVAGVECARLLADEMDGESNVMFESGEYGLRDV